MKAGSHSRNTANQTLVILHQNKTRQNTLQTTRYLLDQKIRRLMKMKLRLTMMRRTTRASTIIARNISGTITKMACLNQRTKNQKLLRLTYHTQRTILQTKTQYPRNT